MQVHTYTFPHTHTEQETARRMQIHIAYDRVKRLKCDRASSVIRNLTCSLSCSKRQILVEVNAKQHVLDVLSRRSKSSYSSKTYSTQCVFVPALRRSADARIASHVVEMTHFLPAGVHQRYTRELMDRFESRLSNSTNQILIGCLQPCSTVHRDPLTTLLLVSSLLVEKRNCSDSPVLNSVDSLRAKCAHFQTLDVLF